MMPLAPTSVMAMPTSKPKIGFSIDSIVGNGLGKSPPHFSPNSEGSEHPMSPMSDCSYPSEQQYRSTRIPTSPNDIQRALRLPNNCSPNELQHRINRMQHNSSPISNNMNNNNNSNSVSNNNNSNLNLTTRLPESPNSNTDLSNNRSDLNNSCSKSPPLGQTRLSPDPNSISRRSRTPSPQPPQSCNNNNNNNNNKGPIIVPGIPAGLVRPFPVGPPGLNELKGVPSYMNSPEMAAAHNPHFLAAQFQMAAALAHGQGQGFPPGVLPQHPGHLGNPNVPRDTYPLYPWLLSRHGRIFPHRFPGSPDFTDFLLQPFRKPKRVRTAFSPSQLLKLEHAFESNHYVVGAERKTLAQALSLTETQVKVWFQNRRTKHKRMQQEEEAKSNGQNPNKNPSSPGGNSSSQISYDEDELIDMDDCPSDDDDHLQ